MAVSPSLATAVTLTLEFDDTLTVCVSPDAFVTVTFGEDVAVVTGLVVFVDVVSTDEFAFVPADKFVTTVCGTAIV